ncbi:hypothetical protein MPSEU_000285600 [Mayamaea pseudoterrestris]|nr:hypothetical protein MPSEU_000285600 [Mayamaea pseudoterrestris]
MQSKPIKNSDFDAGSAKHITFYNENFKRGRCDLLKKIQRSTRGGGTGTGQDQSREIQQLKEQVNALEDQLTEMSGSFEDRMRRLEMDMLARMEQMMLAMQQQQQHQHHPGTQLQSQTSVGTTSSSNQSTTGGHLPLPVQQPLQHQASISSQQLQLLTQQQPWEPDMFAFNGRTASIGLNSIASFQQPTQNESKQDQGSGGGGAGATLPPHPKQKSLPVATIFPPGGINRFSSLRGISALSRGLSGLSRGQSIESTASGVVMKSSWDDKLFSMIMLGNENASGPSVETAGTQQDGGGNSMMAPAPVLQPGNAQAEAIVAQVVSDSSMRVPGENAAMEE